MALKIPPPPPIASADPQFNRWLLELTSILSNQGGIDPSEVTGLPALITQVGTNTTDIATLETGQGGQGTEITILQNNVATLGGEIATIDGQITTLEGRNQVLHGTAAPVALSADGDWFADTTAKHIYVQVSGAWVLIV
jgi:hypothetical protein